MNTALHCYSFDVFLRCILVSIPQVELDRVVEQDTVLRNDRDVLPERLKLEVFDVLTIDQDLTVLWVKDSVENQGVSGGVGERNVVRRGSHNPRRRSAAISL